MTREEAIKILSERYSNALFSERPALETLIPELKESEDEKIRKWIYDYIHNCPNESFEFYGGVGKDAVLNYLEKQKEASKAIEAVDRIYKYIEVENVANAHDMNDSNPNKKYYCGWNDALGKMAGILQDVYSREKQKEQDKCPEYCVRSHCIGCSIYEKKKEQKPVEWTELTWKDVNDLEEIMNEVHSDYRGGGIGQKSFGLEVLERFRYIKGDELDVKEQKPEWSEEDERMLSRCIKSVECSKQFADSETYKAAKDVEVNWLQSLRPQSKQEWSEDDERRRDGIIQWLRKYQKKFNPEYDSLSIESIESLIAWLKSLQPQVKQEQKPVDLEKEMDKYYGMYRDKAGETYDIEDDEPCFDWKEDELSENKMRMARHFYELGLKARKDV